MKVYISCLFLIEQSNVNLHYRWHCLQIRIRQSWYTMTPEVESCSVASNFGKAIHRTVLRILAKSLPETRYHAMFCSPYEASRCSGTGLPTQALHRSSRLCKAIYDYIPAGLYGNGYPQMVTMPPIRMLRCEDKEASLHTSLHFIIESKSAITSS